MLQVRRGTGDQIIETDHRVSFLNQSIAKVGADEARGP
jgi:hypothetical protein